MIKTEDIEPGIQRVVLTTRELYPDYDEHFQFEARLREFLRVDRMSDIMEFKNDSLSYLTESVIPVKQDSRPPLLLLFGNPAPNSVRKKCFFAANNGKREHQFWKVLGRAGFITFEKTDEDINTFRTRNLFDLNYKSSSRIGLTVFYSMPSPASDKKWGGVVGLRRLFRAKGFRQITSYEKKRVEKLIQSFIGIHPHGAVIAFQKDAYLGVKNQDSQESLVAVEGGWRVVEAQCSSLGVKLFQMPITRFISAYWYVELLRLLREHNLGE